VLNVSAEYGMAVAQTQTNSGIRSICWTPRLESALFQENRQANRQFEHHSVPRPGERSIFRKLSSLMFRELKPEMRLLPSVKYQSFEWFKSGSLQSFV
jgi:hypothetical protein